MSSKQPASQSICARQSLLARPTKVASLISKLVYLQTGPHGAGTDTLIQATAAAGQPLVDKDGGTHRRAAGAHLGQGPTHSPDSWGSSWEVCLILCKFCVIRLREMEVGRELVGAAEKLFSHMWPPKTSTF